MLWCSGPTKMGWFFWSFKVSNLRGTLVSPILPEPAPIPPLVDLPPAILSMPADETPVFEPVPPRRWWSKACIWSYWLWRWCSSFSKREVPSRDSLLARYCNQMARSIKHSNHSAIVWNFTGLNQPGLVSSKDYILRATVSGILKKLDPTQFSQRAKNLSAFATNYVVTVSVSNGSKVSFRPILSRSSIWASAFWGEILDASPTWNFKTFLDSKGTSYWLYLLLTEYSQA